MNYEDTLVALGLTQKDMDKAKATLPIPMLTGEENSVYFSQSRIDGIGTFAIKDISQNDAISPLRRNNRWTLTGMLTNHADNPNAKLSGDELIANRDIKKHEEVCVDYLQIKEALLA